jgi:hypothetical protein
MISRLALWFEMINDKSQMANGKWIVSPVCGES